MSRFLPYIHGQDTDYSQVIFEGETTFGYEEWSGPLVSVSGTSITVTGASGSYLNGNGADYWDGEGSNGGKTKPKFFYAHSMISSTITDVYIQNAPVQVFSVNTATDLALTGITIDNSAGDSEGANTDGFDIGSSSGITITGANVYNQDDCVAINSGTVGLGSAYKNPSLTYLAGYYVLGRCLFRWPWSLYRFRRRQIRQHRGDCPV